MPNNFFKTHKTSNDLLFRMFEVALFVPNNFMEIKKGKKTGNNYPGGEECLG